MHHHKYDIILKVQGYQTYHQRQSKIYIDMRSGVAAVSSFFVITACSPGVISPTYSIKRLYLSLEEAT